MEFKDVKGFEPYYSVTDTGKVFSKRTKIFLKPYVNTGGYLRVNLVVNGTTTHAYIHRLVADAFIPNPKKLPVVNHIDADVTNNHVENLEWCSQKSNIKHSRKLGNQNKDTPVSALNIITGEQYNFASLKEGGLALYGKPWALIYSHRKANNGCFFKGCWLFEERR